MTIIDRSKGWNTHFVTTQYEQISERRLYAENPSPRTGYGALRFAYDSESVPGAVA